MKRHQEPETATRAAPLRCLDAFRGVQGRIGKVPARRETPVDLLLHPPVEIVGRPGGTAIPWWPWFACASA